MCHVIYRCRKQVNVKVLFLSFSRKNYPSKIIAYAGRHGLSNEMCWHVQPKKPKVRLY